MKKQWITEQPVFDEETGEISKINGDRIEADTWDEAEKIAKETGRILVGEHIEDHGSH